MVLIRQVRRLCGTQLPEASAIVPKHPDWNRRAWIEMFCGCRTSPSSCSNRACQVSCVLALKVGWLKPMETCKGNTVLLFWLYDCLLCYRIPGISDPLMYTFLIYTSVCTHCPPVRQAANAGGSTNSVSRAHVWGISMSDIKRPPPRSSLQGRGRPGHGPGRLLPLAVPPKRPRHPTILTHPHPSPPVLCHHGGKAKTPQHWPSLIGRPVAGSSAFPTNPGVQSLYRRLILKSHTVFLKCTPTLYGSESSATHEFGDI